MWVMAHSADRCKRSRPGWVSSRRSRWPDMWNGTTSRSGTLPLMFFLTASLSEVHPMTLIEAAMSGLPIVARWDDSFANLVKHGQNGYLVGSDAELATRAFELIHEDEQRQRFSEQSSVLPRHSARNITSTTSSASIVRTITTRSAQSVQAQSLSAPIKSTS